MKEVKGVRQTLTITSPSDIRKDIIDGKYIYKIGLYGRGGSGKSRCANTFPFKKGVVDLDKGGMVYKRPDTEIIQIPSDVIAKAPAKAWEMAIEAVDYFNKNDDIKCIVLDSFTTMAEACMNGIQTISNHIGARPTQPEYGKLRALTKEFMFRCFGGHKHVIIIFHETMEKDELSGKVWCNPLVTGKLSMEIPIYFDELYHMEPKQVGVNNIKYEMLTKSTQLYAAKSRLDSIIPLDTIMSTNLETLLNTIKEGIK